MKKLIMGGLFAVLFSLTAGVTTVYAEDTETSGTISEMESVEEIVDETTTEESSEVDNSVDETITSEKNSVYDEEEVTEESPLQLWFNKNVMPWLNTALAAAGGTGAAAAVLALLIKWIISRLEKKLKEAYEKKAEAEQEKADFNILMANLTSRFDNTVDILKEIYEQKGNNLQEATEAFAAKYSELQAEMVELYKVINQVAGSNKALESTVKTENSKLHELMQSEQKQMLKITESDMKLITEILIIAFTNMPYLVSNGYATSIKKAVQNHEKEEQSKNI